MHSVEPPPRRTVIGLWIFVTIATLGFSLFLGGLFGGFPLAAQIGLATFGFGALIYLVSHFSVTSLRVLSASRDPAPVRVPAATASPENFDHLLSHTLEPTGAPETLLEFESLFETEPTPGTVLTVNVEAEGTGTAPPPKVYDKEYFVHASKRKKEFLRGLPLLQNILGEEPAATDPRRPGKTRGQCSGCGVHLWAPAVRPIRLRCPNCSKVAWLE